MSQLVVEVYIVVVAVILQISQVAVPAFIGNALHDGVREEAVDDILKLYNIDQSEIDWLVPHQANKRIIDATAKYYRIKISDILGKKRTRNIARPRQVAMSLTKELTTLSLPSIGDAFGGRDHTTVMHGVKAVAKLREEDPELAQDYEKLLILIQN